MSDRSSDTEKQSVSQHGDTLTKKPSLSKILRSGMYYLRKPNDRFRQLEIIAYQLGGLLALSRH